MRELKDIEIYHIVFTAGGKVHEAVYSATYKRFWAACSLQASADDVLIEDTPITCKSCLKERQRREKGGEHE